MRPQHPSRQERSHQGEPIDNGKVYRAIGDPEYATKYHFVRAPLYSPPQTYCSARQIDETTAAAPKSVAADERCRANGCRQLWRDALAERLVA